MGPGFSGRGKAPLRTAGHWIDVHGDSTGPASHTNGSGDRELNEADEKDHKVKGKTND